MRLSHRAPVAPVGRGWRLAPPRPEACAGWGLAGYACKTPASGARESCGQRLFQVKNRENRKRTLSGLYQSNLYGVFCSKSVRFNCWFNLVRDRGRLFAAPGQRLRGFRRRLSGVAGFASEGRPLPRAGTLPAKRWHGGCKPGWHGPCKTSLSLPGRTAAGKPPPAPPRPGSARQQGPRQPAATAPAAGSVPALPPRPEAGAAGKNGPGQPPAFARRAAVNMVLRLKTSSVLGIAKLAALGRVWLAGCAATAAGRQLLGLLASAAAPHVGAFANHLGVCHNRGACRGGYCAALLPASACGAVRLNGMMY